jgi:hypothetical protein
MRGLTISYLHATKNNVLADFPSAFVRPTASLPPNLLTESGGRRIPAVDFSPFRNDGGDRANPPSNDKQFDNKEGRP